MRRKRGDTQQAQVLGEYAIVIGVIAFVCIVALLYFGVVLRGDFQSGGEQVQQTPFQPPTPSAPRSWPTALADCEHDGWKNFPQFANEDECVEYVDDLPP
jgi:hypothetical protein